ncbi:MAG: LacI family DNA-binding transcriptional regulator, partial [Chloroflexota bacterium]
MPKKRQRKSKSVTIFDVAKEAGVSYSTVSRVVNGFQFVKGETRERVLAAMNKLGYVANLQARSLAGGQSRMIGLLIHDLENSYINEVIKGIDSEISKLDYDLLLATTHQRLQKEPEYVKKLTNGLVDGLIIILPRNLSAYQAYLEQTTFPYVVIDPDNSKTDHSHIQSLNWQGAFEAT